MRNNVRYKGNISNHFFDKYLSHFFFFFHLPSYALRKLNKTPSDGACLGEPPGGFCDFDGSCCFSSLQVFTFLGYFSMPSALHPCFSGP